ncbi:MAG: putative toxin-antitoxin system toxin component, PIN family [Nanoarchaeota archaeon]
MKIVLDTNVLVSGTFWTGDSFRILELIDQKEVMLVLSLSILKEYVKTINSDEIMEKVSNKKLVLFKITEKVIKNAQIISPRRRIGLIKDDLDDNKILECAIEGRVEYIITQDNHLLKIREFEGVKIMTPEEFLRTKRPDRKSPSEPR